MRHFWEETFFPQWTQASFACTFALIDDVSKGDLWYFPAGFPHSIQGLGPDGCEFLLVFDEGMFFEDNTFLISEWVAHTPDPALDTRACGIFGRCRSLS